MGERYNLKVQAAYPTSEFAGAGAKPYRSSKDLRASREARADAKLLVGADHVEDAQGWIPARHSTSSCTAWTSSERRKLENGRWSNLQTRDDGVTASFGLVGSSFRSEDSEVLALWEEKSEKSPKAVSTDLSWLKPRLSVDSSYSPWRGSVSNAVKKIESLSHAFSRSSPVHPKGDATFESPRPSVEYLKKGGGRSSWRDFKIGSSPARSSTETVLHNSPKARYSNVSLYSVMKQSDQLESSLSAASPTTKLRHAVSCAPELQFGSSAAARPVDFNLRRQVDDRGERSPQRDAYHEKRAQRNIANESSRLSCGQSPTQPGSLPNLASGKPKSVETGKPREIPSRTYSLNLHTEEGTGNVRKSFAAAAERPLPQQSTKISVEAVSLSMERCSSINRSRSQSMDEAMLNGAGVQQARAPTSHSQEAGERKPSHRYYQTVTSRERSSRWSSCDDTPLDHIDFVAPSAARFLEDEGCVSPAKSPIKTPGAVPFKWEKEPGKPKVNSDSTASAQSRSSLQLPPRLALRKQRSSPLRERYMNMSMSAPLAELYPRPSQKYSSSKSECMKVHLPWIEISITSEKTTEDSCPTSDSERGPCRRAAIEPPITKSRSAGDMRGALQTLSRLSAGGDAEDQGAAAQRPQCTENAPQLDHDQKPAHLSSGDVRPTSPTSILCGPGDGSHPSSNPSLSSEPEAPQISATAASAMSHSRLPSCASFDSMEHSIDHSSEFMSPESSLTSPLRANTRCNSMSDSHDFDHTSKYSSRDCQKGASQSENAFVKFCKTGKRWMKTKTHSKLGTIYSPEVWTPGITLQLQRGGSSDFSARLDGGMSTSKIDHSRVQIESRFAPSSSALPHEDIGDRSPAYAATLELLSPVERYSSFKTSKTRQTKPPRRPTRETTSRLRVRARMRARFLVPMRRVLRTLFSRCTFRRRNRKAKAAESRKPLYHVDYTLSQADF